MPGTVSCSLRNPVAAYSIAGMENLLATDLRSGEPSNYGAVFKSTAQLLRDRQIPFVFIGTLALDTFVRPRFTDEMEIVCDCNEIEQLADELRLKVEQQAGLVEIKLCKPSSPSLAHALHTKASASCLDTPAYFPTAPSLCWIFLERDDFQSTTDAGTLLAAGVVNRTELATLLEQHGSKQALSRLETVEAAILQGQYQGLQGEGYSDSVRARLQRPRPHGIIPAWRGCK